MNTNSQLSISAIKSPKLSDKQRKEILDVCSRAYEEDFSPYLALLDNATHLIAYLGTELVSHAAWVPRELRLQGKCPLHTAYVEAVATLPEHQRKGYGSTVLAAIPPLIWEFDIAALSPSEAPYYAKLGWVLWKGPLAYLHNAQEIETPDEEVMVYRLPKTPQELDINAKLVTDWRPGEIW
ncbi:GNAT family N-acetyltransferase [Allochromatium vinosum]|uniref:GNAT family N-acetyltransferase n=1 Tax=Allochromatium vinosum TaxID=1049 RepID=UPI0019088546|nr:GNAT family N-acetyltransferase [Allochromatium vinosum]MBK1654459.1 hypothetical protein [Allochromatium vinosum]